MHYYSHNIGDYRKDTSHLSMLEHGAYRALLDTYYLSEEPLPLDDAKLMRSHSARTAEEMQAIKNVLQDFFVCTENGWIHKRCDKEIAKYQAKSEKAAKSAKARWAMVPAEFNAKTMRSHCDGYANHKPITNNQEPIENLTCTDVQVVDSDADRREPDRAATPHEKIIELYHELLPTMPQIRQWTSTRRSHLQARWREDRSRQDLDWWRRFFGYVAQSDFLTGRVPQRTDRPPFAATLDWIIKPENFAKILEGKYENAA